MKPPIPKIPLARLLSLSKAQYLSHFPPSLRPQHLAVGALIFKPSPIITTTTTTIITTTTTTIITTTTTTTTNKPRPLLLLLKRAAHDPAFPNLFAVPGGHVESTDRTLLHSLAREVLEETGLRVRRVVEQIDALAWVTVGREGEEEEEEGTAGGASLQLMFVCEVAGGGGETTTTEVRVDAREHSMGCWVDGEEEEEGRGWGGLDMSEGMRRVVEDAFRWKGEVGKMEGGGGLESLSG